MTTAYYDETAFISRTRKLLRMANLDAVPANRLRGWLASKGVWFETHDDFTFSVLRHDGGKDGHDGYLYRYANGLSTPEPKPEPVDNRGWCEHLMNVGLQDLMDEVQDRIDGLDEDADEDERDALEAVIGHLEEAKAAFENAFDTAW